MAYVSNVIYCNNTLPNREPFSEEKRRNSFILCFSNKPKERFWASYANCYDGVCFEVVIRRNTSFYDDGSRIMDARKVCYDKGYDFDFYNHLNFRLRSYCQRELFVEGIYSFSHFYKRNHYNWEDESRLMIENPSCRIHQENGKFFFRYPINDVSMNYPYCIRLKKIIVGHRVNDDVFKSIYTIARDSYPECKVIRHSRVHSFLKSTSSLIRICLSI